MSGVARPARDLGIGVRVGDDDVRGGDAAETAPEGDRVLGSLRGVDADDDRAHVGSLGGWSEAEATAPPRACHPRPADEWSVKSRSRSSSACGCRAERPDVGSVHVRTRFDVAQRRRPDQAFRRRRRAGGRRLRGRRRRGRRARRRQRRREVDADQGPLGRPARRRRHDSLRRHARSIRSPQDAHRLGIATVYQDLALADNLDVVANLFLGRERRRAAWRRARRPRRGRRWSTARASCCAR